MDSIETTPIRSRRHHIATPHRPSIRGPRTPQNANEAILQPNSNHQESKSDSVNDRNNDLEDDDQILDDQIPQYSRHTLEFRLMKKTHEMFISSINTLPFEFKTSEFESNIKARDQYKHLFNNRNDKNNFLRSNKMKSLNENKDKKNKHKNSSQALISQPKTDLSLTSIKNIQKSSNLIDNNKIVLASGVSIARREAPKVLKPEWHAPWKLYRVISGHTGWVRCIAFEPGNAWFATGSNDRIIKIWDLASGTLKLSLTGHISPVRGLEVSPRQPYLFSCGEDKTVKCWDLEYNKVVRHYHGHLSGVYCLSLHPTLDILVTGGRDSVARVWDMRTKAQIHSLGGHTDTVASVFCQPTDPQIVTGSYDSTIRLWDIVAGKTIVTLTNHKKSVRAMVAHPRLNMFCSGSINSLKQWAFPDGRFVQNLDGHDSIVNALAINEDNVLVSGGDNGSLLFWDWKTGYNFQRLQSKAQSGSIESECGVFALQFDRSSSRLITGEADKTIKIYKELEDATEETHPINWRPDLLKRKKF
ncbi:hypothetical protein NH340_JMT09093 [Sarcoptes scabiei]|nr:hypothetical protein NH340_JMT09093 [Sarcoptes scabiei]